MLKLHSTKISEKHLFIRINRNKMLLCYLKYSRTLNLVFETCLINQNAEIETFTVFNYPIQT